jgi:hypothetical protein
VPVQCSRTAISNIVAAMSAAVAISTASR